MTTTNASPVAEGQYATGNPTTEVSNSANAAANAANAANAAAPAAPAARVASVTEQLLADRNNIQFELNITAAVSEKKASDGKQEYYRLTLTSSNAFKVLDANGARLANTLIISHFQLMTAMRKSPFFGKFLQFIEAAMEEGTIGMFLSSVKVKVIAELVAAGEQKKNPFSQNDHYYDVVDYDRYIYHVVGVEAPTDTLTLSVYQQCMTIILDEMRAARKAKAEAAAAAAQRSSLIAQLSAPVSAESDIPF